MNLHLRKFFYLFVHKLLDFLINSNNYEDHLTKIVLSALLAIDSNIGFSTG